MLGCVLCRRHYLQAKYYYYQYYLQKLTLNNASCDIGGCFLFPRTRKFDYSEHYTLAEFLQRLLDIYFQSPHDLQFFVAQLGYCLFVPPSRYHHHHQQLLLVDFGYGLFLSPTEYAHHLQLLVAEVNHRLILLQTVLLHRQEFSIAEFDQQQVVHQTEFLITWRFSWYSLVDTLSLFNILSELEWFANNLPYLQQSRAELCITSVSRGTFTF